MQIVVVLCDDGNPENATILVFGNLDYHLVAGNEAGDTSHAIIITFLTKTSVNTQFRGLVDQRGVEGTSQRLAVTVNYLADFLAIN